MPKESRSTKKAVILNTKWIKIHLFRVFTLMKTITSLRATVTHRVTIILKIDKCIFQRNIIKICMNLREAKRMLMLRVIYSITRIFRTTAKEGSQTVRRDCSARYYLRAKIVYIVVIFATKEYFRRLISIFSTT